MSDNKPRQHKGYPKKVRIICPECEQEQPAEIYFYKGDPFPVYQHECRQCAYIITESEWSEVDRRPRRKA